VATAAFPITNFTAGEISPLLEARVDLAQYANGCKTLENFLVHPQGGIYRRGGTKYIAAVKTAAKATRLVPFEFSTTQAYMLEFGENYIRVYKDGGQIETGSPSAPVEITTTYSEAELFELQFAQSADILYITHYNHDPAQLSRTSHVAWTLAGTVFEDGPYLDENITATTLTPSGTTGSINITASAVTGINGGTGFVAADVGRLIRIGHIATAWAASTSYAVGAVARNSDRVYECIRAGTSAGSGGPTSTGDSIADNNVTWKYISEGGIQSGYATVSSITSTTIVACAVQKAFGGTSAETSWRLGAWYEGNYPRAVAFYEQRLMYAGSLYQPQTIWGSKSGDYYTHTPGALDDDAIVYTIASDQVNAIYWLSPGKVLAVGTAGGEFKVSASTNQEALTPTNVRVVRETNYGSSYQMPLRIAHVALFVQRAARKLREFVYQFETDAYVSPDLTLLAEHITETGITQISYQQEPDNIVWCVLTNGTLVGFTYQRDQKVLAWHKHIIGGASDAAGTQAKVESVASIPGSNRDEVYVVVQRLVNGATKRYVELLSPGLLETETQEDCFYVDSGLTLNSPQVITAITKADPVVVTSSSHTIDDGDLVDFRGIAGTTELNGERYRAYEKATNTFEIADVAGKNITAVTEANPGSVTCPSHGFTSGDEIAFFDVGGMTELEANGFTITVVDANTFTIGVNSSSFTTFTSGGTAHLAVDGTGFTTYISGGTARTAETAISGLAHLEGQTVNVLGNGAVQAPKTVASGAIALDTAASIVHAGLGFTSQMETQRIEAGSQDGTAQGKVKRIHEVILRLYKSLGVEVGRTDGNIDAIPFRDSSDEMGSAPELFTGDKRVDFAEGYNREGTVYIRQQQPLPLSVRGIFAHLKTNG
tara:strand:+ start:3406 stop:6057 length:2652 start_codon:yes stop_codon:yes gene_type:complete